MSLEKENFKKSIFVHIPRTAGTAAKFAVPFINDSCIVSVGEHYTYRAYREHLEPTKSKINSYFTFSIIRNPLERLVSLWCSDNFGNITDAKVLNDINELDSYWVGDAHDKIPFDVYVKNLQNIEDRHEPKGVSDDYLNALNSYDLLKDEDGEIKINFLLYNKTLKEDIVHLLNATKTNDKEYTSADVELPDRTTRWGNATTPRDKNHLDFYNDETIKIAKKYYEKDFDYFDTSRW